MVSKGLGVPWNTPEKTTFTAEFCDEYYIHYIHTLKTHIEAKTTKQIYHFKVAATHDRFSSFQFRRNFEEKKPHSPKGFFQ